MATVKDILTFIETVAPPYMKEDWDHVGLNCGHMDQEVSANPSKGQGRASLSSESSAEKCACSCPGF